MSKYKPADLITGEIDKELGIYPLLVRQLLYARGIRDADLARNFLNPSYDLHTHNPFLMKGMERAVDRVFLAIQNNERVAVFGDYDADGIPGAVILHDFFKKIGFINFEIYIPDRQNEGFGLNSGAIKALADRGAKLLLTVDCGIADLEEVALANALDLDVIITDHHLPLRAGIPEAFAVLNPKQPDCGYPEKTLCGSGVVFKFVQAFAKRVLSEDKKKFFNISAGFEKWFLDMAGLATLSDMVPLVGENRVFAHFGLKVLRKSRRKGLNELLSVLRLKKQEINEDDVGFSISPRINAASRMGVPLDAFRLFATDDDEEAKILASRLDKINNERKGKVASLAKEVRRVVEDKGIKTVVVAGSPNWKPSLLGLVANSLAEDFSCPVFLWGKEVSRDRVELKGSCRSGGRVNLSALMEEASSVFSDFGGHNEAGGFSTTIEKVHLLESELERAYEKMRRSAQSEYLFDAKLSLDEVNWEVWNQVSMLAPFGVGNHKPVFLFEDIVIQKVEKFGKDKQHIKLFFENTKGEKIQAVRFFAKPEDFDCISAGNKIRLLAHLERSTFGNYPELRLRIVHTF